MRVFAAALAVVLALAGPALADKITLSGEVTYRERIALPTGGVLSVSLFDLSTPGVPRVAARAPIAGPGQVPLTFTLNFDESVVVPGREYGLSATISGADGAIWFSNPELHAVDPLAPEPILILVSRPAAPAKREVEAATPETAAPLPVLDITWQAVSIRGNPVAANVVSSLSIASDMRAGGRGGCNSWFAQAELTPDRLQFSAVAATRMACLSDDEMAQEAAFFDALSATRRWRLEGDVLTLLGASGAALAVLEKSPF